MTPKPLIYLISDGTLTAENYFETFQSTLKTIENAAACGVPFVQIREKSLPARQLFELAQKAVGIARGTTTKILINDRSDIARAAGADGVHLTSGSLPVRDVRRYFGAGFIIGVSTHDIAEVRMARNDGADFAVFGPVFETPGKGAPVGLEELRRVVAEAGKLPLVALGGIDETNCEAALSVADGIAAIRFLNDHDKCRRLMRKLNER